MKNIHIKLDIEEALNSKKQILSSELNLLNIIKTLQEYKKLRSIELKSKIILRAKLKKIITELGDLKKQFPKAEMPETTPIEKLEKPRRNQLEKELKAIKEKLASLS